MDNEVSDGTTPSIERDFSALVARLVRAQYRRCWRNAAAAMRHLGEEASYVEGWIVVESGSPLVIEHGWCEVEGWIVDPTYTPTVSPLREPLAYHAGVRMAPGEAMTALRSGVLPVTFASHFPAYEAAFRLALLDAKSRLRREPRPPTRVVNCRYESCDVYIGRATKWGNPFRIGVDGTREQVVRRYRRWAVRRPGILRGLDELRGKRLGCICAPHACHGDVLAELADFGETVLAEPATSPTIRGNGGASGHSRIVISQG
jgi:hypothetical protein